VALLYFKETTMSRLLSRIFLFNFGWLSKNSAEDPASHISFVWISATKFTADFTASRIFQVSTTFLYLC